MAINSTRKFEINGVIDTNNSVLDNLNTLANASGAFLTWDPTEGLWSVIPNDIGTSIFSFNDSNIIGSINVSGSNISDLYNAVSIEFPHKDLRDTRDYVDLKIPQQDRFPQELDNLLTISLDCINNPIQAQYIASRELKQSRIDKVIEFRTDYTANGLRAGDLVDITVSYYGFNAKKFRIISIEETDSDDGSLVYAIQALEYDPDVYNTTGLEREYRTKKTGVVPKAANQVIIQSEQRAASENVSGSLQTAAGIAALTQAIEIASGYFVSIPLFQTETIGLSPSQTQQIFQGGSESSASGNMFWPAYRPLKTMLVSFEGAQATVTYTVDGVQKQIIAGVPTVLVLTATSMATGQQILGPIVRYMEWSSYITQFNIRVNEPANYNLEIAPLNTYDLNATDNYVVIDTISNVIPNAQGDGMTATISAFLE